MIIGLLGKKGSGKDTLANYLVSIYNYERYGFGDPVKEVSRVMFDFNSEQLYGNDKDKLDNRWNLTPRQTFQIIGTEFAQKLLPELIPSINEKLLSKEGFWLVHFENWYNKKLKENSNINIVISDVRFLHEIMLIKKMNGIII